MLFFIIVAVVVIIVVVIVKKTKTNDSANKLKTSPHYDKYRVTFDYIIKHSPKESYKIDWLLDYLDNGGTLGEQTEARFIPSLNQLPAMFIVGSISDNLPYFCVNEDEYDKLRSSNPGSKSTYGGISTLSLARRGDAETIATLASYYSQNRGKLPDPHKMDYWKSQLISLAESGDKAAQSILCGFYWITPLILSQEEINRYYSLFYSNLINAAKEDWTSLLVYALYLSTDKEERKNLVTRCAKEGNLSDAWLELSVYYGFQSYEDEEKGIEHTEAEKEEFDRMKVMCCLSAAKANNGLGAATCQYWVSRLYKDGDYFLPSDLNQSLYFEQLAKQNGCDKL